MPSDCAVSTMWLPDMSSAAASEICGSASTARISLIAASRSGNSASAVWRAPLTGTRLSTTRVMTPSVPSEPMNSCRNGSPALSLRIRLSSASTSPEASATSRPSTRSRMVP